MLSTLAALFLSWYPAPGLPTSANPCEWRAFPYVTLCYQQADGWSRCTSQPYYGKPDTPRPVWSERDIAGGVEWWVPTEGRAGTCSK